MDFDALFTKARPQILEKICLSLNYESFKICQEVNRAWKGILTSQTFKKKAKSAFEKEISTDEVNLLAASGQGNVEEARKLISVGMVDVDCADKDGYTPLHRASLNGYKNMVQFLLRRGADPAKPGKYDDTPLHEAAKKGYNEVVQLFLDNGVDPNKEGQLKRTPLHFAASRGHKDVVQLLLDRGSDPNKTSRGGHTPLFAAVAYSYGDKDVVHLLLNRGADPYKANVEGGTPLHWAAYRGNKDIVQALLRVADPNIQDVYGRIALHYAWRSNCNDVINMIKTAMAM